MSKPKKTSQPRLSAADKAEAILGWLDSYDDKRVPLRVADQAALEKSQWWQYFKAGERSATKAVFDKLAAQGIIIHKQTKSPCHLLEGDDGPDGFTVRHSQPLPPQLVSSPLNLKKWRQEHRMIRQLFKLYLKKTGHVRFFTIVIGPVRLPDLNAAITALHERIGWLAHREWLKKVGLEFVLRKTEVPLQNAGQAGAEQVFLHTHIAVRSSRRRRLGKEKWKALLKKLKQQSGSQFAPHDAGEIADEDRQPNYLFKNPVSAYAEDPNNPNSKLLNYERLEILTPPGTKQLYEALRNKRLVYPLGDFAEFIRQLEDRADKAGKELKLQARLVGNRIQVKLVRVPKPEPRQPGQGPVKDLVIAKLPGKRIVRGYSGATHLPKPATKANTIHPLSPPKAGPLQVTARLIERVGDYIQRLGQRQFITREINVVHPGNGKQWERYDHWTINATLEKIPWIKPATRKTPPEQPGQPAKVKTVGRGEWRRWRVNARHSSYPGLKRKPRINPATLATATQFYLVPPDDPFAPGYWAAQRAAERKVRRREYRRQKNAAPNDTPATPGTPEPS